MNDKQRTFCEEYVLDFNGAQAAIRAGYSEKTAKEQASQLLTKLNLQEYVAELIEKRSKEAEIDAAWVLKESVNTYKAATLDKAHTAATSALKLVGQHVDVQALVDRKHIDNTHRLEDLTDTELLDRLKRLSGD